MTSGTAVQAAAHPMAWTNERLKLSCADGIGFKSLWKMLVLDKNGGARSKNDSNNTTFSGATIAELLESRHHHGDTISTTTDNMSLLKCLAINALELSAPASPMLLLQQQPKPQQLDAILNVTTTTSLTERESATTTTTTTIVTPPPPPPCGWLQLAGHPESIAPAANGTVRKRISGPNDSEAIAYRGLCIDPHACHLVPQFYGCHHRLHEPLADCSGGDGTHYLELQNLLHGFNNPAVMDIKMGCRTFLESEVTNDTLRPDLYRKMAAVDSAALSSAEHDQRAITKLRYMLFREQTSSSQQRGFRVEALKQRHRRPVTDLKTMKCGLEVDDTIGRFVDGRADVTGELIERLRAMRTLIERSAFFAEHEVVGSSVFIVYDAERVGAWLIDFAKCRRLPVDVRVDHRRPWRRGNHEEGLLHGFDELIAVFERIRARQEARAAGH